MHNLLSFFLWDYRNKLFYGGPYHSIPLLKKTNMNLKKSFFWVVRPIFFQISNGKFHFKFQLNFQKISFQISIENFQIISFHFFVAYFNFFHFPMVVWPKFSNFNLNLKINFFSIFLSWYGQFFFKIQKNSIQNSKHFFSISYFSCGINESFLGLRLPNLF
jgi:hypothetical protein